MTTATLAASFALAVLLASPAATATGRSLEQRYISTRDGYVRARQKAAAKDKRQSEEPFVEGPV